MRNNEKIFLCAILFVHFSLSLPFLSFSPSSPSLFFSFSLPLSLSLSLSLLFHLAISFCETLSSEALLSKYHRELFVRHSPHHSARGWKGAWNKSRTNYMQRNVSETNEQSVWPDRINLVEQPCYNFQVIAWNPKNDPEEMFGLILYRVSWKYMIIYETQSSQLI